MKDQPSTDLELVSPQTAEAEATIKVIRLGNKGAQRSEQLHYAYAAITGAAANRLADILPRGTLELTLQKEVPEVSKSQLHVWRNFAKDLLPHLAESPMVGLLTAPVIGKKQIPAKKLEGLQEAVKKVLKGASMVEFHKASQFAGEVEHQEYHPPKPLTPEEVERQTRESALFNSSAMAQAVGASNADFFLTADEEVNCHIAVLERGVKARKAWLRQPKDRRNADVIVEMLKTPAKPDNGAATQHRPTIKEAA